jgi:hypothetical protein
LTLLVHITAENLAKRITRNGITPVRGFVWAFPILKSYTLTHSWSREMKRTGRTTLSAISFRVPDDEMVFARHYREERRVMTAAGAVGYIRGRPDPRGYEIMLPRRINPREIVRVRVLPKAIGWRYSPEAKGKSPSMCECEFCSTRGEVNASRQRTRPNASALIEPPATTGLLTGRSMMRGVFSSSSASAQRRWPFFMVVHQFGNGGWA